MAFRLRVQFPGANYHVINRGNYRKWIFDDARTRAAFTDCLFEACARHTWRLHAFVVMSNHYHLGLETPLGNLASGMQWLQATFANRFNRFRDERGHLFQSRYKALLVEPGDALARVCDYIHLNPVRAGIVSPAQLGAYSDSSYCYLSKPSARPSFLHVQTALTACYRPGLLFEPRVFEATRKWERLGPAGALTLRWSEALAAALAQLPATSRVCRHQSAAWKRAVALHLHETCDVSNGWLAEQLEMGSAAYVSKQLGLTRRRLDEPVISLMRRFKKVKGEA